MQVVKYMFQLRGDERGQLVALEEFKDIPFEIKRVYYMYDTAPGAKENFTPIKHWNRFWFVYMEVEYLGIISSVSIAFVFGKLFY